jgi:hypothetical protein
MFKFRLSGLSRVECCVLSTVSANIAVTVFMVNVTFTLTMATVMFAETLDNTEH